MSYPKGKYRRINPNNSEAKAVCDRTGFTFNHNDLVKQMEWRGDSLQWTGLLVGRPFVDFPNEQNRTPVMFPDPVPIELPRPYQSYNVVWSNQNVPWSQLTVLNWASWSGSENGILAAPENERLSALQAGVQPNMPFSSGGYTFMKPDLTQQQILDSLTNYNWSAQ